MALSTTLRWIQRVNQPALQGYIVTKATIWNTFVVLDPPHTKNEKAKLNLQLFLHNLKQPGLVWIPATRYSYITAALNMELLDATYKPKYAGS